MKYLKTIGKLLRAGRCYVVRRPCARQQLTAGRAHKHWKSIVEGVLIPTAVVFSLAAVAALYAWYTRVRYRRRQRPMTDEERERYQDRLFQERLEELGLIPLQTVNNSPRGRIGLRWSAVTTRDPISNRRARGRNRSVNTTAPLLPSLTYSDSQTWTPRRPGSAITVASSIGQRSVHSPLSPHPQLAPPLPVVLSTPHSSVLTDTQHHSRVQTVSRSFSSLVVGSHTIAGPVVPNLPPVNLLVGSSTLVQSLRIYKQELIEREQLRSSGVSLGSFLEAARLRRE